MKYFSYTYLARHCELRHGVFSRSYGISKAPFNTGNISFSVGDEPKSVLANRQKIKQAMGLTHLFSARQIHGDKIFVVDDDPEGDLEVDGYDVLVSNRSDIGLMIQQADCQAIMLFDPVRQVIANIHSGWRGSALNIIGKTISLMVDRFGTEASHLLAGISPSLGPCCAEFVNYKKELPRDLHKYQKTTNYFDFWAISKDQLEATGVLRHNIEIAEICTLCDLDYFSYRREKITGRFASVIGLIEVNIRHNSIFARSGCLT